MVYSLCFDLMKEGLLIIAQLSEIAFHASTYNEAQVDLSALNVEINRVCIEYGFYIGKINRTSEKVDRMVEKSNKLFAKGKEERAKNYLFGAKVNVIEFSEPSLKIKSYLEKLNTDTGSLLEKLKNQCKENMLNLNELDQRLYECEAEKNKSAKIIQTLNEKIEKLNEQYFFLKTKEDEIEKKIHEKNIDSIKSIWKKEIVASYSDEDTNLLLEFSKKANRILEEKHKLELELIREISRIGKNALYQQDISFHHENMSFAIKAVYYIYVILKKLTSIAENDLYYWKLEMSIFSEKTFDRIECEVDRISKIEDTNTRFHAYQKPIFKSLLSSYVSKWKELYEISNVFLDGYNESIQTMSEIMNLSDQKEKLDTEMARIEAKIFI